MRVAAGGQQGARRRPGRWCQWVRLTSRHSLPCHPIHMAAPSSDVGVVFATHTAPTNIACIKYWGKRDAGLNLPLNSSVSVTLNQDDLKAVTTVIASPVFDKDRLWLNGKEEDITANRRVQVVLREIRSRAGEGKTDTRGRAIPASELAGWKVHIVSKNTFPTAAGLASSAAGYAALVHTLADVYGVKETVAGELTAIARQGSGSACRSLYGGFVAWEMGTKSDGSDSIGVQIADEAHWPELRVLIAVVSDKKKDTGSTDGMKRSAETSELLATRTTTVVPRRMAEIKAAYLARDFDAFGRLTMADSNQFHAVCLDTYPPIFYMNDVSKRIIALVHAYNAAAPDGRLRAAYTFDAGPNAVIYTTASHAAGMLAVLKAHFPPTPDCAKPFVSSPAMDADAEALMSGLTGRLACDTGAEVAGGVRHVYVTSVGDGPRTLTAAEALADVMTGLPLASACMDGGEYEGGL